MATSTVFQNSDCVHNHVVKSIVVLLMFLCAIGNVSSAATLNVPGDYPTIQQAINAATNSDEIIVSPGTYLENINIGGKNITLRSTDPTNLSIVVSTIIDGSNLGSVVTFAGTESPSCVLSGFTITHGQATYGGGIQGNATLATIQNNLIQGNSNTQYGGGLDDCDGIVQNNTIFGNSANYGGGLYICTGTIINCIVWQNTASTDGAQFYSCAAPSYSCIQAWSAGGTGNIATDPFLADPAAGDFHLTSVSPCIDAGGNVSGLTYDYEGDPRPYDAVSWETRGDGSDFDIGADEFIGTVLPSPPVKPTNLSPANGATRVSLYPTLRSSAFSDPDPLDTHAASQWQVDNDSNFSSPVFDSGVDSTNKTARTLPYGKLAHSRTYYWRVRHCDNHSVWSDWSDATYFTTRPYGTIFVPSDHSSIQAAINDAYNGEQIIVSPGTYKGTISFGGKDIVLSSTDPTSSSVVATTIIDAQYSGSAVTFSGSEPPTCVLSGLSISHGHSKDGAGIRGQGTQATIQFNDINSNAGVEGAQNYGIGLNNCDGLIQFNKIRNNLGPGTYFGGGQNRGGGLCGCDGIIQHNLISGNTAATCWEFRGLMPHIPYWGYGGGLDSCNGTIENNTISNNSSDNGGGLSECGGTIKNNIIWNNHGDTGGGIYGCSTIVNNTIFGNRAAGYFGWGGGIAYAGTLKNCIVWGNSASDARDQLGWGLTGSFCCIQDWTEGGTGNISFDPQLANPAHGDFHLLSTSPCIDAGAYISGVTQDFEGNTRPFNATNDPRGDGSDFDIGADEFIGFRGFGFADSQEGWTTGTAAVFAAPQWAFEIGALKLTAQTNTNTFGFWVSPSDAVITEPGYLYRARFVVKTDVTDQSLVPQIRVRVNATNFQQADFLTIESIGDGGASPTPAGTIYDLYFKPPTQASSCMLAFDLLNLDPSDAANAAVALDSVLIDRFALDTLPAPTLVQSYTFAASDEGWTTGGAAPIYALPNFAWSPGELTLTATTNTNSFGYWKSNQTDMSVEANRLYRGTFEVRSDVTDRSRAPQLRLRFNTANFQVSRTLSVESVGDGANSPGTSATIYDGLYLLLPANCVAQELFVSFDIYNISPDDAAPASVHLDQATIETLAPPTSP